MRDFLRKLFTKNPNKCHQWGKWHIIKSASDNYGNLKIVQGRVCLLCHKTQLDTQQV